MPLSAEHEEALGNIVDRAEAVLHASSLALDRDAQLEAARGHLRAMRGSLRSIRDAAHKLYVEIEGNDPWETNPLKG